MQKLSMTVIGFGPMGKRFTKLFSNDFEVIVSSSRKVSIEVEKLGAKQTNDRQESISKSDFVFLAVPINALSPLVFEINKFSKENTIIIDCCSARILAEKELQKLQRNHFGLHDIKKGEYCVIGNIDTRIESFFRRNEIGIREVSAEEHDQLNAIIGLGHFIGLTIGKHLSQNQLEVLGGIGSGSLLVELSNGLKGNSQTTWEETQIDNPYTKILRKELISAFQKYDKSLEKGIFPY